MEEEGRGEANGLLALDLPMSFHSGLEHLRTHPQRLHVPYFLQCFIELFGGWYAPDTDGELELMAQVTGFIKRFAEPDHSGYNGFFYVGAIAASPPATGTASKAGTKE